MLPCPSLLAWLALASAPPQGDWPQFRGPGGRSVADDTPIPVAFGPGEQVLWRTRVPPGHSSPCIVGEAVFLTGFERDATVLLRIGRADGRVLWSRRFEGPPFPRYGHVDATPALTTPASDGERVIAYVANHGLVALTLDGEPLWELRLPHPGHEFGVGTSPVIDRGRVFLARDGAPESVLLALDARDGHELWRADRSALGEAHGSPFVWEHGEGRELVLGGTGKLCSYDPESGKLLWSIGGVASFPCTTPAADAERLYYAAWSKPATDSRTFWRNSFAPHVELSAEELADTALLLRRLDRDEDGKVQRDELPDCPARDAFGGLDRDGDGGWSLAEMRLAEAAPRHAGKNRMVAVARGARGPVDAAHLAWSTNRGLPYVASPLLYRGRLWLVQAGGLVTVLEPATGKVLLDRERLPDRAEYHLSPVGAAGHVLVASVEGTLFVLDASAETLAIEHTASFGEPLFASPAVLGGVVYLRTRETLWAFGAR